MALKVYMEPAWKLPASYDHRLASPPAGYEFVAAPTYPDRFFKALSRWEMAYRLLNATDGVLPTVLARSWLQRWSKPPAGTLLTYAHGHLVFRPESWVVEVEYAHLLLGLDPRHLKRFQGTLERVLASPHCRKIRCWSEAGRRTLVCGLNSEAFGRKIEVIPHAVPPRPFAKEYGDGKVKLLFVGSPNIKGQFDAKGGREVVETFALLRQRYHNLELVVRSDLPTDVKARYGGMENLTVMDQVLPWEVLEREYRSADIFLLPSHSTPPFTILDAMSYELPVVTIDTWANGELVEDGKTGLVAQPSRRVPYYYGGTPHPNYGTAGFERAIRVPDPEVVSGLVGKVSRLIEDPELRRNLGRAARHEVEAGRFSLMSMNQKLKQVFDEAIADPGEKR